MSADYVARVNRAIDYILGHLDQPIKLDKLAQVACFSPFHFHRVFRSLLGETLNQFVRRVRLERALSLMTHHAGRSLTEIALECGFSSSSDFSRTFKQRYGMPPSAFDLQEFREKNRDELQLASAGKESRHLLDRLPAGENPDGFSAHIRELPARTLAYIRVMNSFEEGAVFKAASQLMNWAVANNCADGQWLGYMWDDPEIVSLADCRYDIAVQVEGVEADHEVGSFTFPPMLVAEVEILGGVDLELRALDWLYGTWLPNSPYLPSEQPSFEAFHGRPFEHGLEHFELNIQLPIIREA